MTHHFVSQIVHVIWSTKNQQYQIPQLMLPSLYAYISTVIKSKDGKLYIAGGNTDHIHCLISLPPSVSLSTLMNAIKSNSSKMLKHNQSIDPEFQWESGYTAFSIQADRIKAVCKYIENDSVRHKKTTYQDEIVSLLKAQSIPLNEKFLFTTTYAKLLIHVIWSTKNRAPFLDKTIRPLFYQHMSNLIDKAGCVNHAIGGIEDHIHVLFEPPRNKSLSDVVNDLKTSANHWVSSHNKAYSDFAWQIGFGAFSISLHAKDAVIKYIAEQEEHHKFVSPIEEWNSFVLKRGI